MLPWKCNGEDWSESKGTGMQKSWEHRWRTQLWFNKVFPSPLFRCWTVVVFGALSGGREKWCSSRESSAEDSVELSFGWKRERVFSSPIEEMLTGKSRQLGIFLEKDELDLGFWWREIGGGEWQELNSCFEELMFRWEFHGGFDLADEASLSLATMDLDELEAFGRLKTANCGSLEKLEERSMQAFESGDVFANWKEESIENLNLAWWKAWDSGAAVLSVDEFEEELKRDELKSSKCGFFEVILWEGEASKCGFFKMPEKSEREVFWELIREIE